MRYRVTASDGRRVENTIPVGLLRDFPTEKDAWREVDKLGLAVRINEAPYPGLHPVQFSTSTWERPKTLGKNQAYALSGTAVVGAQATEERFAE